MRTSLASRKHVKLHDSTQDVKTGKQLSVISSVDCLSAVTVSPKAGGKEKEGHGGSSRQINRILPSKSLFFPHPTLCSQVSRSAQSIRHLEYFVQCSFFVSSASLLF